MAYEDDDQQGGPVIPDFLRDPLGIPGRRWPWMVAAAAVGLIVTGYLAWSWKPAYRAWASITIDTSRLPEELIRSTVEESDWGAVNALKLEVFTRDSLNAWIEQFDLYPELRTAGRDPGEAIYALRSAIQVQQGGGFGGKRVAPSSQRSFNISVEYEDPKKAAQVTNAIADEFVKAGLHDRTQQAAVTADFLRRQLDNSEKKLRAQETKIKEYIEAHRGELPEELNGNLRKLDQLQSQRQGLELRISQAEQQLNALLSGETDPNSPQARLLSLRLELQHALAIYTEEHPQVASLRRQIANIEGEIAGKGGIVPEGMTPQAMVSAQRRQLDLLHQQLADIEKEAAEVNQRVANTPTRQDELNVLNREAGVLREEYMSFLRKVQEAELSRTVEAAQYAERIAVTDRAKPPGVPERPRWKLVLLALAGTIGAAVGVGVGLEFLDPVLVAPDQLEHLSGAPVLGTMYRIA